MDLEYYINRLDTDKYTGYAFRFIRIPLVPLAHAMILLVLSAILELTFSTYFIQPIVVMLICHELVYKDVIRNCIMDNCVEDESALQDTYIREGVNPDYPEDSINITDEDRWGIFETYVRRVKNEKLFTKIKHRITSFGGCLFRFAAAYIFLYVILFI